MRAFANEAVPSESVHGECVQTQYILNLKKNGENVDLLLEPCFYNPLCFTQSKPAYREFQFAHLGEWVQVSVYGSSFKETSAKAVNA